MNNKKPKKIIFIKNEQTGGVQQAVDMDLYLKQRQQGKFGSSKLQDSQFLVGVPPSTKSQYRKNCCGRKS